MTTTSPPLRLYQLHPIEQLLALLVISAAALHRLFSAPPRSQPTSRALAAMSREMARIKGSIRQPQASAAPAVGIAPGPTVAELRTMARQRGIRSVDGRALKYCKKARLIEVLSNG